MVNTVKQILYCFMAQLFLYGNGATDSLQPFNLDTSLNLFSNNIYSNIIKTTNDSIIISPFSIYDAMALVYTGSGGSTEQVLENGLSLGNANKSEVANSFHKSLHSILLLDNTTTLNIANKIYVMTGYSISNSFKAYACKFYSSTETVNFTDSTAAANIINAWVEQKTNNKIQDLVSPSLFDFDTRLMLVNAIYFKGDWLHPFDIHATNNASFFTSPNVTEQIDMMHVTNDFKYGNFSEMNATAVILPYKATGLLMVIILPNEKDGLPALENALGTTDINTLISKMNKQKISVSLPKFSIGYQISLNEILRDMGMGLAFSNAANFSNMLANHESLAISNVIHKAHIEVNEQGAEAAAATGVIMRRTHKAPRPSRPLIADHPFAFYLMNNLDPLFVGRFAN